MAFKITRTCQNCAWEFSYMNDEEAKCPECGCVQVEREIDWGNATFNIYQSGIAGPMNKAKLLPSEYKEHMTKLHKAYGSKNFENY